MVVVGNGRGKVGWGYGKANEVPPSVEKASKEARAACSKSRSTAAPFRTRSRAASARPASCSCRPRPGTGVIAGSARPCGLRSGRHPQHPHQELRLEQSHQPGQSHLGGPAATAHPVTTSNGCEESRCHEPARYPSSESRRTRSASASVVVPARATARPAVVATRARANWPVGPPARSSRVAHRRLIRRIPKRGFHNEWGEVVVVVNVGRPRSGVRRRSRGHRRRPARPRTWPRAATTC